MQLSQKRDAPAQLRDRGGTGVHHAVLVKLHDFQVREPPARLEKTSEKRAAKKVGADIQHLWDLSTSAVGDQGTFWQFFVFQA
jgi:hypothetical protein